MPSLRFDRILSTLGLVVLLSLPSLAAAEVTVLVDGAAYPADLRENTGLLKRLHMARLPNVRHVEGELRGIPGSWIRASLISRRWQGVVALEGVHFVIDAPEAPVGSNSLVLAAQAPEALAADANCGTEVTPRATAEIGTTTALVTAQANFAQICQTTVNGVCLLAQLEVAFDLLFQQRFPTTFQSQAAALLNVVDGFYKNDMKIQFDEISLMFLTTNVFSTTTDSSALLTDIDTKKNSNPSQIPGLKNKRAIFHLMTGRSFDGNTVGIASVGSLCQPNNNTGTSQFISSVGLTALVMAHEMGHNFGAGHDVDDNTCTAGFIMAPQVSSNITHFSSCSINEMTAGINAISNNNLPLCFEFPVDASIAARPGNPTTALPNTNFTLSYDLDELNASVAASQLTASGSLSGASGMFVSANVNGSGCTVAANGATYTCTTGSAGGLLEITARVNGSGSMNVQSHVAASATGSVKDITPANDTVTSSVVAAGSPPTAPSMLAAVADAGGAARIVLTWTDNSGDETGFSVERKAGAGAFQQIVLAAANATSFADTSGLVAGTSYTYRVSAVGAGGTSAAATSAATQLMSAPVPVGGGGGGGGSFGIELAPLLLLTALRRRQRAA